ncbi:sensor histidine kinase [Streptomyces sp. NBC_01171]|uniref:sensor histidine kinase n=1 Tax=Streptomyces sp. NBC_01171 TaxID=2903757 RepID=UPI0038654559|nr:HAMP domain-containing histidine kinase [Streptomyces sp. NBC_01171]
MKRLAQRLVPRTLRGRLSLVALTTAALIMTLLTFVFNLAITRHLQHQVDAELRNRAEAVATTIDTSGSRARVLETANDHLLDTNVWIYADGRLLERPPSAPIHSPLSDAADDLADQRRQTCTTDAGQPPMRECALPLPGNHAAGVVTAMSLGPYRSSADTLLLASLALDAAMLACTYILTRLSLGRALRPMQSMTDRAAQWSAVGSEARFGAEHQPVELARLGGSLDVLLDRIRTVLRHERQLTGELSHELRTPLTRMIVELDWWQIRPRSVQETRDTHRVLTEAAQSMRAICDTLLNDARDRALDHTAVPGTTDVVPSLERLLQSSTPDRIRTTLETGAPVIQAATAPALLERILSPLLANAVRYARTTVTVAVRRTADAVRIDVTDDGPGVPEAFVRYLFVPGRRAEPGDGHDGAGLGLPLARRLALSVGGDVTFDAGNVSGARFTVTLPAG